MPGLMVEGATFLRSEVWALGGFGIMRLPKDRIFAHYLSAGLLLGASDGRAFLADGLCSFLIMIP